MIGVQIEGVTAAVEGDEIVVAGDADRSLLLTVLAQKLIERGETVSLGVGHPTVPAGLGDPYTTVATIVEAAVRAKLAGVVVIGVESDPGVVY